MPLLPACYPTTRYDSTKGNKSKSYPYGSGCKPGGALERTKNPTCSAATYSGGLQCCYDGMNLLDADQPIPPLVTHFRFRIRIYFTDYTPSALGPRYDTSMCVRYSAAWAVAAALHATCYPTCRPTCADMVLGRQPHSQWGARHQHTHTRPGLCLCAAPRRYLFWEVEEWQTEYDIRKAPPGTPPQMSMNTLTTTFKAIDLFGVQTCPFAISRAVVHATVALEGAEARVHARNGLGRETVLRAR